MINIFNILWAVSLFFLSASLSFLVQAGDITRLDLSLKEVMSIYSEIENKPTLNSCRVHKKENRYYLPKECNFFVFTAYILENECVTGSQNKIAIGNNAMNVNFKVNKNACHYVVGKSDTIDNNQTDAVVSTISALKQSKKPAQVVASVNTPVLLIPAGLKNSRELEPLKKTVDSKNKTSEVKAIHTNEIEKMTPNKIRKKSKKYFLQIYAGDTYPRVKYECDNLKFYTNVIGKRIYILSSKYNYTDAVKAQSQTQTCGFKAWIRPVDMEWT